MNFIEFNGKRMAINELNNFTPSTEGEAYIKHFIISWQSGVEQYNFKTSGSTGEPKSIIINKSQMLTSARATIQALGLRKNTTALLCINPQFIGGSMMIVRALINEMNLIVKEPSSNPIKNLTEQIHFAAFVPLQIHEIVRSNKKEIEHIDHVIIGGAPLSENDTKEVSKLNNHIYSTYGMTETVSHIALKQLSPTTDNYFRVLKGINITKDNRNCLVINGDITNSTDVITNDVVNIFSKNEFEWLGRYDNVINTGGVKIQSEQLEFKIQSVLNEAGLTYQFFVAGISDDKLGEKIVMFVEAENLSNSFKQLLGKHLGKYELPKDIICVPKFSRTESGKINKLATIKSL
ncbi:MAG: AMP-binding protein [Fulvivirga sp.]|uniref:AMP-binding protein n=1 Tax=Fulvivirga sp. TaxID=1931237 RepID=UPI0032EAFB46